MLALAACGMRSMAQRSTLNAQRTMHNAQRSMHKACGAQRATDHFKPAHKP